MAQSLDEPPVNNPISDKDGMISDTWRQWITNYHQSLTGYLSQYGIMLPPLTTTQRNSMINIPEFVVIGNKTTGEPQIYLGGSWKDITHT